MKRLMHTMVTYFENVPDQVRKWRAAVWLFFIVATVFFAVGIGRVKFDMAIEAWFQDDDPTIAAFDWFHHEFGSDDHLYIVYKPKDGDVFSETSLKKLQQFQQELQGRIANLKEGDKSALTRVVKITSLINAPVLKSENGTLISKKLIGNGAIPGSAEERDKLRKIAASQPNFPLLYFSKDYKYGGVLIETNFGAIPVATAAATTGKAAVTDLNLEDPGKAAHPAARPKFQPTDMADYLALMREVNSVIQKPEYASHFDYYPVGSTAAGEDNLGMVSELGMLNVVALVVIVLLLALLFRSLSAVVWPVVIFIMSVIWIVGITGWLGLPITFFVMVVVMLTLAVGVADTVHVMAAYLSLRQDGHDHRSALRHGFRHVVLACLLTTITNIAAVVALSITPIVPIQIFVFMCCLGVGLPFMFSVYLLPLMLDLWSPKQADDKPKGRFGAFASRFVPDIGQFISRRLERVLPFAEKRPLTIMFAFATLFCVCIYGATLTKVNTDPVGSFPKKSLIRKSVKVVDENMMGAQSMEIYLDLGKVNAFHDPFVLNVMDKLQHTIERQHKDVVVRTDSLVGTVKNSYQTLNDNRPDMYVIPASENAVSQTLFMFNQSNPEDRRKLVSDNYDRARISVRLYNRGSFEYTKAWDGMRVEINGALDQIKQKYPDAKVSITGMLALMMQGAEYLTASELQSFTASIVMVSMVLLILFGSIKAGVIALVPNLIPTVLAYGGLGLLDMPLDVTTMMIAPIIIGIAVDDTVHFITHYRSEVATDGNIRRALDATISQTGQSIAFTTLVLGLGFGTMGFASNAGVANLGIFGGLAIIVGLLNDLFLLPAMIMVFKLRFHSADASQTPPAEPGLALPGLER
jgi:predicted RND superfamily exporter protein